MKDNWIQENKVNFITKLAEHVLKSNYFEFNKQLYHQTQSNAMGTRMAPNYAIIFMHKLETETLKEAWVKPQIWKRFVDNIFIIWTQGQDKLIEFLEYINNLHSTITCTLEQSLTQMAFLDTLIYKDGCKPGVKVYHKATNDNQYLQYTSAHQKSHKTVFIIVYLLETDNFLQKILILKQRPNES